MKKDKKIGLVLEGGSMRGMFTMGVLDIFMDNNIPVDGIIGVSAGALFGPNYYSRQRSRALRYNQRFCKNPRFMSFWSFLFTGNLVNKQFAFYDVTLKYDLFDNETFKENNKGYYAVCTNVETGQAEYLEMTDVLQEMEILRATSAIPVVSKMVEWKGKHYLDGGISDSIPIRQCQKMGYDKIIVVLTRPIEYRKKPLSSIMLNLIQLKYQKYPNLIEAMKNRHTDYNNTVEYIQKLEAQKQIFVIRPSAPIHLKTIERNPDHLQEVYDLGCTDAQKQLNDLIEYLNE